MVTVSDFVVLILTCITFLPSLEAGVQISRLQSAGLGAAFNVILPAFMGMGTHYIERFWLRNEGVSRFSNINHERESSRLLNMFALASVSYMSWSIMNNLMPNDMRMSLLLLSAYAYSHGRALFMDRQSKLLLATSQLLPATVGIIACSRIPHLSKQVDRLGKSSLVFGLVPLLF